MDLSQINLKELASGLEPMIAAIHKDGAAFADVLGSEVTKKAGVGIAYHLSQWLGKAVWSSIKSSRAHAKFVKRLQGASSPGAREEALRLFFAEDPKLAKSSYSLLVRHDFLRAVLEHAENLPNIILLDESRRLSEIYVPLSLQPIAAAKPGAESLVHSDTEGSPSRFLFNDPKAVDLLSSGNHLVEGEPGSGKSTLARRLIISHAERLIDVGTAASLDQCRLPVLVTARSLNATKSPIASALQLAVREELSVFGLGPLPDQFFVPYSEFGHRSWLVVIDGLDEIEDRDERQRLWEAVSRPHSQIGDAFRFIVLTRPEAIRVRSANSEFQRWSVCPLLPSDRKLLAHRYIQQSEMAERFLAHISSSTFATICSTPLFEAIAASVFAVRGELPDTRLGLCEAFVSALLEKSSIANLDRHAVLQLLTAIAETSRPTLSFEAHPYLKKLLPPHLPQLAVSAYFEDLLRRSGLVAAAQGEYWFIHDVFRSYFLSLRLAEKHQPSSTIWKAVDPFGIGWTTVQYLCEAWEHASKDISSAVNALLEFGDKGESCATEVAIACNRIGEKIVKNIVDRIFREMFSTGPSIAGADALTRLARRHLSVKKRLLEAALSNRDFMGAKLQCAECLLDAGQSGDGVRALLSIAQGEDEDPWDRTRAAELLFKHGYKRLSEKVLNEVARGADQLWIRAEAACILFENARTEANREFVTKLLKEPADEIERVWESTIARLLSLGETEIALPAIRERAKLPNEPGSFSELPREQIAAAKALATHYALEEGVDALRSLLNWPHISMRGKAEVIEALGDIGAEEEARRLLQQIVQEGPKYVDADWFFLEMLTRFGLTNEARSIGLYLLERDLATSPPGVHLTQQIDRLTEVCDRNELAQSIRAKLRIFRSPRLAVCLAMLGFRNEAVRLLKAWVNGWDVGLRIDAAEALCTIGERYAGLRVLNKIVKDKDLAGDARIGAAWALERTGDTGIADKAYLSLVRDPSLSMEERCRLTRCLDEYSVDRGEVIRNVLFSYVQGKPNPVHDRVVAAQALLNTTLSGWEKFD
jgi:tetratricopeptide (TPR) repeat protein